MKKIGLALSGGGFRASLYHLGLVRFLRDSGILSHVTHITSVSGGSIFAANLVLNWERYNGSPEEFDAAAAEFLSFVRLDVRNRITRRFPLTIPLRWSRRLLGRSNRKLTRTGLLEFHYEKYLYGDTLLFELPEKPQLHLLATNLSEGCLCSFTRNGLLMVRRQPGNTFRIDRIHIGLATVAMAVTASSAFPGFFPPIELTSADVGASVGEFGRQAYTDGGVFDNLGVRMFRYLERPLLADNALSRDDFFDLDAVVEALREAGTSSEETPLHRLAQILVAAGRRPGLSLLSSAGTINAEGFKAIEAPEAAGSLTQLPRLSGASKGESEELVLSILWDLMCHYQFHHEPIFAGLKLEDPDAESLLHASRLGGRVLDTGDRIWLNRHLLEAAFRQGTGDPCFRRLKSGLDGVLVSDVGKPIEVQGNRRAGGLIRTALRATDILMDRVWQLETDTFQDTPGCVFAPITDIVDPAEDPTALHPEIQRQVAKIRTDLDRFSTLEISSVVRHGYCVGRKACRTRPYLFGPNLAGDVPWDPIRAQRGAEPSVPVAARLDGAFRQPAVTTVEARALQASAFRRIWSTLLDRRDWTSYIYVPLLVPILFLTPYFVVKSYQRSLRVKQIVESLTQGSRELDLLTHLVDDGPEKPWTGEAPEQVRYLGYPDFTGFEILQDSRVVDLRRLNLADFGKARSDSLVSLYLRMKVHKQLENAARYFPVRLLSTSPKSQVRFPQQQLVAWLRMSTLENSDPDPTESRWEANYDFQSVPAGDYVDVLADVQTPGLFLERGENSTGIAYEVDVATAELTMWILMPEGKEYKTFRVTRHKAGKPEAIEAVALVNEYLATDFTIVAFKLQSLKAGYIYEVSWFYK
jgi:predicted acylesterase/phospholipase RssA